MGLTDDHLDERIARHPGMPLTLDAKLRIAERAMQALSRRGRIVTLSDLIHSETPELIA